MGKKGPAHKAEISFAMGKISNGLIKHAPERIELYPSGDIQYATRIIFFVSRKKIKNHLPANKEKANEVYRAFEQPDAYINHLCLRARESQWSNQDMDWTNIDFSSIPQDVRQSAVNMFCQLNYGEITAYLGSARMSEIAPSGVTKDFFMLQTEDESRHTWWFSTLIAKLECESKVLPSVQHLMDDVYGCDTIEEMVVGMHIIIEGMAHSFFIEGTRAFSKVGILKPFMGDSYYSAKRVFSQWLPNFLGKDEGRHLAFGIHFLRERLQVMCPKAKRQLEAKTERWAFLYQKVAEDPNMLAVPGLNSKDILYRTTKRINTHLQGTGIGVRIEA